MRRSLVSSAWIVLLAGPVLAGCFEKPVPETPSPSTELPSLPVRRPVFQFLNCTQVILAFELPRALVDSQLPSAFVIQGLTLETTSLRVMAQSCPRTVGNDSVYGRTSQYWTFVFATPRNHSWYEEGYINWYVFDYATDSEALYDRFQALGLPVERARISLTETPLPTSGRLHGWEVASDKFSSTFHYRTNADQPQWGSGDFHLWFGTDHFKRVDYHEVAYVDTLLAGGEFVHQGESRFGSILKSPASAWEGSSFKDSSTAFAVNREVFV